AAASQPPLVPRSGFQARLKPGVAMTSDVKGWEQLFYVCLMFFPLVSSLGRAGARKTRRLLTLLPADGLDRGGALLQAQLEMTADCGWLPRGPGTVDQGTTGMRLAGLGHPALLT